VRDDKRQIERSLDGVWEDGGWCSDQRQLQTAIRPSPGTVALSVKLLIVAPTLVTRPSSHPSTAHIKTEKPRPF